MVQTVKGTFKAKHGPEATIPTLDEAVFGLTTDTKKVFIGSDSGNVQLAKQDDLDTANSNIASKANQSDLDTTNTNIGQKADKTYVDSQNALKADKTYVDQQTGDLTTLQTTNKTSLVAAVNSNTTSLAQIAYNVKSYGAKGDGVTDDTTAVMSALSAVNATGGILDFPVGTYIINQPILITHHGVRLKGRMAVWGTDPSSKIMCGSSFSGNYIVRFDSGIGYIRSVGMENLTIDGGSSNADGVVLHRAYDFCRLDNVMVQNISDTKNAWRFEPDNYTSTGQTITATNLIGTHRTNNAIAPTFWIECIQESVFINCKAWAGKDSTIQSGATCFHVKGCSGVSFYDCTSAFTTGYGIYFASGDAGRGNNVRFINHTFEETKTPFFSLSTTYKMTGTITGIPVVGATVKQGTITGTVTLGTSTGVYVMDASGAFTTGTLTDVNGNNIGTITAVTQESFYNVKIQSPRLHGNTTPLIFTVKNCISPEIDITSPYGSVTVSPTIDTTTQKAVLNLSYPMTVADSGVDTQINIKGYTKLILTSPFSGSGTLPKAYKGMEVQIIHDRDLAEQLIYPQTGDTIEGQPKMYVVGNASTSQTTVTLVCQVDGTWRIKGFTGRYYLNNGSANLPYNINHTRQLTLASSASVGAQHTGYTISNNGATGTVNYGLTSTPNMVGAKITFVKLANQTLTITPNAADIIRGASAAGKYLSLTNVGDSVTLLNVVSGYWEIVQATGSYTFQP